MSIALPSANVMTISTTTAALVAARRRLCKQALINEQICVATGTSTAHRQERKNEKLKQQQQQHQSKYVCVHGHGCDFYHYLFDVILCNFLFCCP